MKCHQCEKQAMFILVPDGKSQFPLCLYCSNEFKKGQTDRIRALQQTIEYYDKTIDFQLGFTSQLPAPMKAAAVEIGDVTLNHINISNSNVGMVNTGKIQAESIDLSIDALIKGNEQELAKAIKDLTTATLQSQQVTNANRNEIVELLAHIAEESIKPPEYRKKNLIMSAISRVGELVSLTEGLAKIWEHCSPTIKSFFGF